MLDFIAKRTNFSMVLYILFLILLIWCGVLTYLFLQLRSHYNSILHGADNKSLQATLDELLNEVKTAKEKIIKLEKNDILLDRKENFHIQKIGLLRFNPFKDTGGDQSFILALLDKFDTGIVISGLYARSGTRWYAKRIVKGKGIEYELSDEEKKAIAMADNANGQDSLSKEIAFKNA